MRREVSIQQAERVLSDWVRSSRLALALVLVVASGAVAGQRLVPQQYVTIQAAVDASAYGDEVVLSPGTYTGDGNRDIDLGAKTITVRSTNPDDPAVVAATVVDCQGTWESPHRGFRAGTNCTIAGLTIANGCASATGTPAVSRGGAVYSNGVSLSSCALRNNQADEGGAVCGNTRLSNSTFSGNTARKSGGAVWGGSTNMLNCTFSGNTAGELGGAAYVFGDGECKIAGCRFTENSAVTGGALDMPWLQKVENSTFERNVADYGGALVSMEGIAEATDCRFVQNVARLAGGAVQVDGVPFERCMFEANRVTDPAAGQGGGVYATGRPVSFVSCLFSGNSGAQGGAVYSACRELRIDYCTIVDNSATEGGGLALAGSDAWISGSILWANAPSGAPQVKVADGDCSVHSSDVEGGKAAIQLESGGTLLYDNSHNIEVNPRFVDVDGPDNRADTLADNNYRLAAGSPCIDWGDKWLSTTSTDLDGYLRRVDDPATTNPAWADVPPCDLGAYEYGSRSVLIREVGSLSVVESGVASFRVKVSGKISNNVQVEVSRSDGDSDICVQAGSSLTFTPSNYDQWQTVTLAALDDSDASNGTATIRLAGPGLEPAYVGVSEVDNDSPPIWATPPAINVPEGGQGAFWVRLLAQPAMSVTVSVSRFSGDSDISVQQGASLTFTKYDWSDWQKVTLSGAEDADIANGQATIRCSASGAVPVDVTASEVDNDSMLIVADRSSVDVYEGNTANFKVKLSAQPTDNMVVTVARSDGDPDISVQTGASLVFTPADWSTYKTVTLAAAEDADGVAGVATIECASAGVPSLTVTAHEVENDSLAIIASSSVTVPEGGTAQFQVKLAAQPLADVQVDVAWLEGDTSISVQSGDVLMFTPANWDSYQLVTLAAVEDEDVLAGSATIQCSAKGWQGTTVTAHEQDNDMWRIGTDASLVKIPEGGTAALQVKLTEQPIGEIHVSVAWASGDSDITVQSGGAIVFTPANWDAYQTVILAAANDADMVHGQATIRCGAEGLPSVDVTAREVDKDAPVILVDPPSLDVPEGGTATFRVKLSAQPAASVQVNVSRYSGDTNISIQSGWTRTFTTSNWNTYQVVTVGASEDADPLNGEAVIRCSASGLEPTDVIVREMDNDMPELVLEQDEVSVPEGSMATFRVKLSHPPAGDVQVQVERVSGDADIWVQTGTVLTFTTANWGAYQTVILAAAEDADAMNGQAVIRCSAAGMAARDVVAHEIENEGPAVLMSVGSVSVPEGSTSTFGVRLSAPPTGNVQVNVSRASGDGDLSVVSGAALTFTPANWNAYQTVTLAAAEDADVANGEAVIRGSGTGLTAAEVMAREVDNDVMSLVLEQDQVSVPEGSMATFRVKLFAQPAGNVQVSVSRVSGDDDVTVKSGAVLTFTPTNWNAYQTVTLAAAEDEDLADGEAVIRCSSAGMASRDVVAHEIDNDMLGLVTNVGSVSVPEGATSTFQVKLTAQPTGNMQVNVSRVSGDTDLSVVGGAALMFTPTNWSAYQTVIVAAAEDADVVNGEAAIRCGSDDLGYRQVTAREVDNDTPGIVADTGSVVVPEGGTAGFGVRLSAPVTGDLTVSVAWASGDADVTVQSGASLVFTPGNWNVYQTVTLSAAQDADNASGQATIRCSASGAVGCEVVVTEQDNWVNLTAPVVSITAPTDGASWVVGEAAVSVSGTASDDGGVVEVAWANDRGGSGLCSGTTAWTAAGIPLAEGQNVITITARDAVNQVGTDTLVVTLDGSAPVVQILSQEQSDGMLTLTGMASDNRELAEVSWANDRGGSGVCSGTTDWSAAGIALAEGQNAITVTAKDGLGHVGASTVTVTYTPVGGGTGGGGTGQEKPAVPGCGFGATSAMMAGLAGLMAMRGGWRRQAPRGR